MNEDSDPYVSLKSAVAAERHTRPELIHIGSLMIHQIWLATHNAEIIDEAGRDRVTYVARDLNTKKSIVTKGLDEAEL